MNRVSTLIAGLATLMCVSTVSAQKRKLDSKETKIERHGYALKLVKDWNSMPQKPGETLFVGSWQPDQKEVELRGDFSSFGCRLRVVRFAKSVTVTGSAAEVEAASKKREEEKEAQKRLKRLGIGSSFDPTNLEEFLDRHYEGARKRCTPKPFKARKLKGELLEFTKGSSFVLAALFDELDYQWGVFYEAGEDDYEKEWSKVYKKSLTSFRVFPVENKVGSVAPGKDMSKLKGDAKREAIKAGIAGSPGWWAHDTENYVFLTNTKEKGKIKQLGRQIETLRAKVYEQLFPPSNDLDAICIARVFADQNEYFQYGGPRGSAGYWDSSKEELVLFFDFQGMSATKSDKFTKSVMYHEAFHQYIYYAVGDLAPHSWFNEGPGDYFAGSKVSGRGVSVKPFSWRVNTLKRRLSLGKGLIPIQSLVRLPQSEYYSNAGLKYAQGWALVYFLRKVTRNKEWRQIPDRYFSYLRDNVAAFKRSKAERDDDSGEAVEGIPGVKIYNFDDAEKVEQILSSAVDKGFEGVDYEKLDAAYLKWIKGLKN